jgi:hypothetical protein
MLGASLTNRTTAIFGWLLLTCCTLLSIGILETQLSVQLRSYCSPGQSVEHFCHMLKGRRLGSSYFSMRHCHWQAYDVARSSLTQFSVEYYGAPTARVYLLHMLSWQKLTLCSHCYWHRSTHWKLFLIVDECDWRMVRYTVEQHAFLVRMFLLKNSYKLYIHKFWWHYSEAVHQVESCILNLSTKWWETSPVHNKEERCPKHALTEQRLEDIQGIMEMSPRNITSARTRW